MLMVTRNYPGLKIHYLQVYLKVEPSGSQLVEKVVKAMYVLSGWGSTCQPYTESASTVSDVSSNKIKTKYKIPPEPA